MIYEGLSPWNFVVVHSTTATKIAPITIKRISWSIGTHSLDIHRPDGHINIRRQKNFVGLTQKQRVAVKDYQDLMGVHFFHVRRCRNSIRRTILQTFSVEDCINVGDPQAVELGSRAFGDGMSSAGVEGLISAATEAT